MSTQTHQRLAVFESQGYCETAWFKDALDNGSAKDNYDRIEQLRRLFCHPLMLTNDGSLSQEYFTNTSKQTAMDWSDIEMLQLFEGMQQFGVSSISAWNAIQSQFLPQRDFIEVRLRVSQVLATQDLAKYGDRKFASEQEIRAESAKNKRNALESGTWDEAAGLALETAVACLTDEQQTELQMAELKQWKAHVWENPNYIFRTQHEDEDSENDSDSDGKQSQQKTDKKKKVKFAPDPKQNTIEGMLQKKTKQDSNAHVDEEKEETNTDDNGDERDEEQKTHAKENLNQSNLKIQDDNNNKNKKAPVKKPKAKGRKRKKAPLMPEDSEDEEMLCVD